MKKVLIAILFIYLYFINCDVSAESKDVQAIYKKTYNVELVTDMITNNTINLDIDNLSLELYSSDTNVKVVLIKVANEALDYVKTFTNNTDIYYLVFYKNNEKVNTNVDIKIKTKNKVLNVYNNNGKLIEKTTGKVTLTNNDYFILMTDFINIENDDYKILNINQELSNIKDLNIDDNTTVEIYNSKDVKVNNKEKLGTNYKIVVIKEEKKMIYTVVTLGDTTGDAKISLNDVTRLYHHYKGIENMNEAYTIAGDVAKNNIINLNDITKIYHYYKGIIPEL